MSTPRIIPDVGAPIADPVSRLRKYHFASMKPGDAIDVENPISARQAFFVWRRKTPAARNLRLRYAGESPDAPGMQRFVMASAEG